MNVFHQILVKIAFFLDGIDELLAQVFLLDTIDLQVLVNLDTRSSRIIRLDQEQQQALLRIVRIALLHGLLGWILDRLDLFPLP